MSAFGCFEHPLDMADIGRKVALYVRALVGSILIEQPIDIFRRSACFRHASIASSFRQSVRDDCASAFQRSGSAVCVKVPVR
jgi:hypothetical protein